MDDKDTMPIEPLKRLALLGALESNIAISSAEFAHHLSTSPQTASRKLQLLEQENMIARRMLPNGQEIMITETGMIALQKEYQDCQQIFGGVDEIRLAGVVCTGLGEGRYYAMPAPYQVNPQNHLGVATPPLCAPRPYRSRFSCESQPDLPSADTCHYNYTRT